MYEGLKGTNYVVFIIFLVLVLANLSLKITELEDQIILHSLLCFMFQIKIRLDLLLHE